MRKFGKFPPLLNIILCDLILISFVVIGLDARTRNAHKYMYTNTASFFYSRAYQLYETGTYPQYDTMCFAPLTHSENYTPGLAYAGVLGYHLSKWIHKYDFFEFAVIFPLVMYVIIIFAGYYIMTKLYSREAGLIFAALFTIMPVANKLTSPCYFTSESLGVLLFLLTTYFIIRIEKKPVFYTSLAIISLTYLELTWQPFIPILIIVLILALINRKSKTLLISYALIIILPFIIGYVVSRLLIGIDYSPFRALKELVIGMKEKGTAAYSVAMRRTKLKPMGFDKYLKNFTLFAVPLLLVGLGVCIRYLKKIKYLVPLIGCVLGIFLINRYFKFRFIALPFILIVSGIGGDFLYNMFRVGTPPRTAKFNEKTEPAAKKAFLSPAILDNLGFVKVTFFTTIVLLLEIVFFHILNYVYDYFIAVTGISFAILGIGLGAFMASRTRILEKNLFIICCIGTTLCIYAAMPSIFLLYPLFRISTFFIALSFFFPVLYVATIFKNHRSDHVYMYDMTGAFLGVVFTIILYKILHSEAIIFLLIFLLPFIGFIFYPSLKKIQHKITFTVLVFLLLVGGFLFYTQSRYDTFNIFKIMYALSEKAPAPYLVKTFNKRLLKSYDSLAGRVDVVYDAKQKYCVTAWNGFPNDHFTKTTARTYDDYYKPKGIEWPTRDIRVLYGVKDEPKIFICGSAAEGITKAVKMITPIRNIFATEIDPSIIKIMKKDFYKESGQAYKGLHPVIGNAISVLKNTKEKFDIITLINTHSTKNIGHTGPPDYLHTIGSYNLYFEHLTDEGYILFEERPDTRMGELGVYRMINTLYHCLRQRGENDPKLHFVIWEWMGRDAPLRRKSGNYYISMVATKDPISEKTRTKIIAWIDHCLSKTKNANILYLKGFKESQEYAQLFKMIETGNFELLAKEDFDSSVATNNRPFVEMATKSNVRLKELVKSTGILTGSLWLLFTLGVIVGTNKRERWLLNGYNILIGIAYFLIEIILLQIYQNIFVTISSTLVLVLGILLFSSGIGGLLSRRIDSHVTTFLLIPILLVTIYAPHLMIVTNVPFILVKFICVFLIGISGFFMGTYFPKGLDIAKHYNLQREVPYFFAINALGGSFAVILALWLGVKIGYASTIIIAVAFYILASLILKTLKYR